MKYYIYIAFIILISACKQSEEKEIVYKDYSTEKLKNYLAGDWLDIIRKQNNNEYKYWKFIFTGHDYGHFQDFVKDLGRTVTPTDPPLFKIYKKNNRPYIIFTYYIDNWSDTSRIITISNRRLVLLNNKKKLVFYKKLNNEY